MFKVPERYRVISGHMASNESDGNNGLFIIRASELPLCQAIASDGGGWEHVSVSLIKKKRTPTWEEMCFVKSIFWDDEDVVIQYHPAKSEYINCHPYVLHLWRPIDSDIPTPPIVMV